MFNTGVVGIIMFATLSGPLLDIIADCLADFTSNSCKSTSNFPSCCVSHSSCSGLAFASGLTTSSSCCASCPNMHTLLITSSSYLSVCLVCLETHSFSLYCLHPPMCRAILIFNMIVAGDRGGSLRYFVHAGYVFEIVLVEALYLE